MCENNEWKSQKKTTQNSKYISLIKICKRH